MKKYVSAALILAALLLTSCSLLDELEEGLKANLQSISYKEDERSSSENDGSNEVAETENDHNDDLVNQALLTAGNLADNSEYESALIVISTLMDSVYDERLLEAYQKYSKLISEKADSDTVAENIPETEAQVTPETEPQLNVSNITIKTYPAKKNYTVGEQFDPTGLVLSVMYSDNSKEEITSGFSCVCDLSKSGSRTVTVLYEGHTAMFDVTVSDKSEQKRVSDNKNDNNGTIRAGSDAKVRGGDDISRSVNINLEDTNISLFDIEGSVDWYTVRTSGNYSGYSFTLYNDSVDSTLYLTVYDSYEKELGHVSAGRGENAVLDLNAGKNAVLYIAVSRYYSNRYGNYKFTVNERLCDAGMDHDNAFSVSINKEYDKELDLRGINDWYVFTSTEKYSGYDFTLMNNSIDTTAYITVYDEYDKELGSARAGKGETCFVDLMLLPKKTYHICISRYYSDRTGKYHFSVNEKLCDAGASHDKAFNISLDKEYNKELDLRGFDDWYCFTSTQNYSGYHFSVINDSVDTAVYLTVFDEFDKELGSAKAYKGETGAVDFMLSKGREYHIRISRYYSDYLGKYSFSVSEKRCDAGAYKEDAFIVLSGMSYNMELDLIGFDDWFRFTPEKSDCHFEFSNNSVDTTMYMTIYNENDKEIEHADARRGDNGAINIRLETSKVYYIKFSRYYGDRLGSYSFSIR